MASIQEWVDKANDIQKVVNERNPMHPAFWKSLFTDVKGEGGDYTKVELTQEQAMFLSGTMGVTAGSLLLWAMLNPEGLANIIKSLGSVVEGAFPDLKAGGP